MHKFEGQIINLDQMVNLPPRKAFLDVKIVDQERSLLAGKQPVLFLPVNVWETYLPEKNGVFAPHDKFAIRQYKIAMFGILKSGEKVTVILDGILPYFEVRVPPGETPESYLAQTKEWCANKNFKVKKFEIVQALTCKQFDDRATLLQLYFSSAKQRAQCIREIRLREDIETYHDDLTGYYKVVCRDVMSTTCSWCILTDYQVGKHVWFKTQNMIQTHYSNWKPYKGDILQDPLLKKDKTIVESWDIETDDPQEHNDVPRPESASAEMFRMCVNFAFHDSGILPNDGEPGQPSYSFAKPDGMLAMYDITTDPTLARPNRCTILVKNEREMIQALAILYRLMQPDYVVDFNGSNYDWHWVAERARQYGLLQFMERQMAIPDLEAYSKFEAQVAPPIRDITKYWWYKKYVFKLTPDLSVDGRQIAYPGYQCIDFMPQLRALCGNPERYGLNVFLKIFKLGSKVDMPYTKMFSIHRLLKALYRMKLDRYPPRIHDAILERLGLLDMWRHLLELSMHVGEYCTIDGARLHDLGQRSVYIRDRREVGNLSFTSMDDCVNRANGMKVRNMTIARANTRNLRMSNITPSIIEKGKYPGAYVFNPDKGIKRPRISLSEILAEARRGNPEWTRWLALHDIKFQELLHFIDRAGIWWDNLSDADQQWLLNNYSTYVIDWFKTDHHYPIGGLDFASLYPSLIMAYNFSPEMMVHRLEDAMQLAARGFKLHAVHFKFNGRDIKGWSVRHKYAGNADDPAAMFGIFPTILKELFDSRDRLKSLLKPWAKGKEELELLKGDDFKAKQTEYLDVLFNYNYYNSKQKALKVFMNTFYGEAGNALSPLRVLALAGGVTTSGQDNIKKVAKFVNGEHKWRIYYGDSVTADTPILLRHPKLGVRIWSPDRIRDWNQTQGEKLTSDEWNGMQVWSHGGWTGIKCVVKHKTQKKIYRVSTHTGLVDVTEDHSLMTDDLKEIKPQDCKIGIHLLHSYPDATADVRIWPYVEPKTTESHRALIWGFFFGDGSCGAYNCPSGKKYSWALNNQDTKVLERLMTSLKAGYPDREFKILDTLASSHVYKIVPVGDIKSITLEFREEFYHELYKKVPDSILTGSSDIQAAFMTGYYMADGARSNGKQSGGSNTILTCKGKIGSAGLTYLMRQLGYLCTICWRKDKPDIFKITCTKSFLRKKGCVLKKMDVLRTGDEYVYDLVTENHMFQAGIGSMIVHNTDSLYISPPRVTYHDLDRAYYSGRITKQEYMKRVVEVAFVEIEKIKILVNEMLKRDNNTSFLKMAYEELLYFMALFAKKKYMGVPHIGHYNEHPKELFIKGLELVKKGVSKLMKDISNDLMWKMMDPSCNVGILQLVIDKIQNVYQSKLDFKDFVKTATYKPNKANVSVNTFAERMKSTGECPEPLARFEYVMVRKYPYKYDLRGRKTELSVGDRMEYATKAQKEGMPIDLDYYMSANITGQLARFISWCPQFYVEAKTEDDYDEAEARSMKAATHFVTQQCERWSTKYVSQGPLYQTLFKQVNAVFRNEMDSVSGGGDLLQLLWEPAKTKKSKWDDNNVLHDALIEKLDDTVAKEAKTEAKHRVREIVSGRTVESLTVTLRVYQQLAREREVQYQIEKARIASQLRHCTNALHKLMEKRDAILQTCINEIKSVWKPDPSVEIDHKSMVKNINSEGLRRYMSSKISSEWTRENIVTLDKIQQLTYALREEQRRVSVTKLVAEQLNTELRVKLGETSNLIPKTEIKKSIAEFVDKTYPK